METELIIDNLYFYTLVLFFVYIIYKCSVNKEDFADTLKENCYRFETITSDNYLFNDVEETYIMTMENSKRIKEVMDELNFIFPTKKVNFVYSKGWKKCNNYLPDGRKVNVTFEDIGHTNLEIFKDARSKNLSSILVLEDDFFWDRKLNDKDKQQLNQITNELDYDAITLGSFFVPKMCTHNVFNRISLKLNYMKPIQSIIYSKKGYEKMIQIFETCCKDIKKYDIEDIVNKLDEKYGYYKPVIFQTFPETENQKNWHNIPNTYIEQKLYNVSQFVSKNLHLEKRENSMNLFKANGYVVEYFFLILTSIIIIIYLSCSNKRK